MCPTSDQCRHRPLVLVPLMVVLLSCLSIHTVKGNSLSKYYDTLNLPQKTPLEKVDRVYDMLQEWLDQAGSRPRKYAVLDTLMILTDDIYYHYGYYNELRILCVNMLTQYDPLLRNIDKAFYNRKLADCVYYLPHVDPTISVFYYQRALTYAPRLTKESWRSHGSLAWLYADLGDSIRAVESIETAKQEVVQSGDTTEIRKVLEYQLYIFRRLGYDLATVEKAIEDFFLITTPESGYDYYFGELTEFGLYIKYRLKQPVVGEKYLRRCIREILQMDYIRDAELNYLLFSCYKHTGQEKKALLLIDQVLSTRMKYYSGRKFNDLMLNMLDFVLEQGDMDRAAKAFAYAGSKFHGDQRTKLGFNQRKQQFFEMTGQKDSAIATLQTIITLKNEFNQVQQEEARRQHEINEVFYDLSKKYELQQLSIESKNRTLIAISIFGLIVIIMAFVIWQRLQITKKQKTIIDEQNAALEHKNRDIISSINYAKRIQEALLKDSDELTDSIPPHFILFMPKDIVSGDFFWIREKGDYWYIAVADCTGHGVPGAFLTIMGTSFLNEIHADPGFISPAEILERLRKKIIKELGQKGMIGETHDGMDISLICLHKTDRSLHWAGANNPLWIVGRSDEFHELSPNPASGSVFQSPEHEFSLLEIKGDRQPIGFYPQQKPFRDHQLQLKTGQSLYLVTDGYADQFGGPDHKKLKQNGFKKQLLANQHLSLEEQGAYLKKFFQEWREDYYQIDDVCVIGMRV